MLSGMMGSVWSWVIYIGGAVVIAAAVWGITKFSAMLKSGDVVKSKSVTILLIALLVLVIVGAVVGLLFAMVKFS